MSASGAGRDQAVRMSEELTSSEVGVVRRIIDRLWMWSVSETSENSVACSNLTPDGARVAADDSGSSLSGDADTEVPRPDDMRFLEDTIYISDASTISTSTPAEESRMVPTDCKPSAQPLDANTKPEEKYAEHVTPFSPQHPAPHAQKEPEAVSYKSNDARKGKGRAKRSSARGQKSTVANDEVTSHSSAQRQKGKKPSMRTARDVINRIQWDRNLPEDYFDIGYLDRFLGVVEKPFTAFTWGDLAWMEYDVLGIPQHRIQYFKYRGTTVWDKTQRLDAVFGSAGTSDDIEVTMTRVDAEIEASRELRAAAAAAAADAADAQALPVGWDVQTEANENTDDIDSSLFPVDSDDSDGDDDVAVNFLEPITAPTSGIFGVPEEERSTHFIAVRVTAPVVQQRAVAVQRSVVKHDSTLTSCTMRPTLFHITLCMLRLDNQEAVAAASECIRSTIDDLETTLRADDSALRMRHLRTFGSRVLYAPVAPCSSFSVMNEELRRRLRHVEGVSLTNAFDYVPHMTLLKVSRPVARARRSKFIDSAGYLAHERTDFGSQRFDNLHLCAIDADCALDGFYVTESSFAF